MSGEDVAIPPRPVGNDWRQWGNWLANWLTNNVSVLRREVVTQVTENIQPIVADRALQLTALDQWLVDIAAFIGEGDAIAQAAYAEALAAAAQGYASAAQFYATKAVATAERTVSVTENNVTATAVDTLQSSLAGTQATVSNLATTVATGDAALASQISTVQAQANGNTSSIQTITQASGGDAKFSLVANSNGHAKAMFNMATGAMGGSIVIVGDNVVIANPTNAGDLKSVFVLGQVNGVSTIGIAGNLIIDGSLLARHIAAGQITTDKLAASLIQTLRLLSADGQFEIDMVNKRIGKTDGTSYIDFRGGGLGGFRFAS